MWQGEVEAKLREGTKFEDSDFNAAGDVASGTALDILRETDEGIVALSLRRTGTYREWRSDP